MPPCGVPRFWSRACVERSIAPRFVCSHTGTVSQCLSTDRIAPSATRRLTHRISGPCGRGGEIVAEISVHHLSSGMLRDVQVRSADGHLRIHTGSEPVLLRG